MYTGSIFNFLKIFSLFGLLASLSYTKELTLDVIGPVGLKQLITTVDSFTDMKINYKINICEIVCCLLF
jgi:hypothetical protein